MATLAPRDPITQSINLAQYEAYSGENICGTPGLVNYTLTAGDSKEASYSMNVVSSSATGLYDFDRITTGLKNGFSFNNQDNAALTSFNFVNFCDVGSDGYNTLLREVTNVDKGGYDSMRVYSTSIQYGPQNMSVNKIIIIASRGDQYVLIEGIVQAGTEDRTNFLFKDLIDGCGRTAESVMVNGQFAVDEALADCFQKQFQTKPYLDAQQQTARTLLEVFAI